MKKQITLTVPELNRKNLLIAGAIALTTVGGIFGWNTYQQSQVAAACKEAREVRRDARRFMARTAYDSVTAGSRYAVETNSDATDIFIQANTLIKEQCGGVY